MHLIRAVTLSGYLEVARFVGLDGLRALRQAGISSDALADPENPLPAASVVRLIEKSAADSGCESFGLLLAERRSLASLGPISLLLERLPNVREIIRTAIALRRHFNDVIEIELDDADDEACLIKFDLAPGYWGAQTIDLFLGIAHRVLTEASGGRWTPSCVHSVRKAPRDLSVWRRMFAAPLEFESDFSGFSSTRAAMLRPNRLADPVMARHAGRLLRTVRPDDGPTAVSELVRRALIQLLPSGRATIDQVGVRLGMSSRSLQRRLDDEGHQFAELLTEVRRELAGAYLANSSHPITSVAGLVGYASPSSFTRWFATEFGKSPQAWRAENKAREAKTSTPT